jgi:hypothetical protein
MTFNYSSTYHFCLHFACPNSQGDPLIARKIFHMYLLPDFSCSDTEVPDCIISHPSMM